MNSTSTATRLPCLVLDLVLIRGRGRPHGVLGGASRVPESSIKRLPSTFELQGEYPSIFKAPPSTAPAALTVPNQVSTTYLAMARLQAGHVDLYEPGTIRERGYMHGISSVFKDDSIKSGAEIAARVIEKDEQPIESQMTTIVVDTSDNYT